MSNQAKFSIPYGRHTISEEDISAVVNVLRSPFVTQGPMVPAFEQALLSRVGASYGVAVNSATSALHLACLALGLGPGDRLWTSPVTFVASANCALYCNAQVDFVDINPLTGLISVDALQRKLSRAASDRCLPKVLVPVHLSGTCCPMIQINELASQYGVKVIEDASHALGGQYYSNYVGACHYSDITVFSFHPVKIITTAEGGMATTNDHHLAQRMVDLRSHGITKDISRFLSRTVESWTYEQHELGYNYRITDIQASLGISQLDRLEAIVSERHRLFQQYKVLLYDLPVRLLDIPQAVMSAHHLAVIRLVDRRASHHRKVFNGLRAAGIGVQLHYSSVHLQPYYRKLGFKDGDFPEAEAYSSNAISLPLFPGLLQIEQQYVADTLASLLKA